MRLEYHVVDVFTQVPLEGNALAVFPDARLLDTPSMQRIARELNLSETSFVFPAQAGGAAQVRIFTPSSEMEFAGHPTIGTAYVMRKLGIVPASLQNFILEENVGPVPVRVDAGTDPILWLETPPIKKEGVFDSVQCARTLGLSEGDLLPGLPCALHTAGNPNIYIPLVDVEAVDRACVDASALRTLIANRNGAACLFIFTPTPYGAYSRMFAPELGVVEDPATGSATGPLAAYMMEHQLVDHADGTRFYSEQGTKMGRRSILHVLINGDRGSRAIEIGGNVVPVSTAQMTLPD